MTKPNNGITVTDIDAAHDNNALTAEGYTIRTIELPAPGKRPTGHDASQPTRDAGSGNVSAPVLRSA